MSDNPFGFPLDFSERKCLSKINKKPYFGKVILNFREGKIKSTVTEVHQLNSEWKGTSKTDNCN